MSLGNVPKRNGSREDRRIAANLKWHAELMALYISQGMDKDAASKKAFDVVTTAKTKLYKKYKKKVCQMLGCTNPATVGDTPKWCRSCAESIMFDVERPDLNIQP